MKPTKHKASETTKEIPAPADNQDEPYRYPLDLVAKIAVRFVDSNTSDKAATDRAIVFLDNVEKTIAGKMMWIRARKEGERIAAVTPIRSTFAKGIIWITSKRTAKEANKAYVAHLRLHLRLSDLGRPAQPSEEQVAELMSPRRKKGEGARISKIIANYQSKGFNRVQLVTGKEEYDRLQKGLVIPYQNSKKGKSGGRPRGSKKSRKKSLDGKSASEK